MDEDTRCAEILMKNIREILLEYKNSHHFTNVQMAVKCEISLSEYERIMNVKRHGSRGCYSVTLYKIHKHLGIDLNSLFDF